MRLDPGPWPRRARLAARRVWAGVPGQGLRRPCLFVHLPKCGGTSVTAGLAGLVPVGARVGAIDAVTTRRAAGWMLGAGPGAAPIHEELDPDGGVFPLREGLALTHIAAGARLIHGHVMLSDRLLSLAVTQGYGLVTLMREPRARALSNYAMAVRAGVIPDDLDRWLWGPIGARMAQSATRYLSGRPMLDPAGAAAAAERAATALTWFAVVGVLERPAAFRAAVRARFGAAPAMPRLNRAPAPAPRLSAAQAARLTALTAPDRALYAAALARAEASEVASPPFAAALPRPSEAR